jgi:XTP/dITP diphosphohydrolase
MAGRIGRRLLIATHNPGKVSEMRELLEPYGIETLSAQDLHLPEPEETGASFIANAELKARAAAIRAGLCALADDSGLCVDALGGKPGIHSARWAGEGRDFAAAMQKIEDALRAAGANAPFKAHFVSVLSIAWPDGETLSFEGKVHGELVFPPRGQLGFGYDPIFLPEGLTRTFGEMASLEKHSIPADDSPALSHRARAFQLLARALLNPEQRPASSF